MLKNLLYQQQPGFLLHREALQHHYSHLIQGQSPQVMMLTCCDSRIEPSLFLSSLPGDVFMVRNIGNMVPPIEAIGHGQNISEYAAIAYAVEHLAVKHLVVCGHSHCGAITTVARGLDRLSAGPLKEWLVAASPVFSCSDASHLDDNQFQAYVSQLSQDNVKAQLLRLRTYPEVKSRCNSGDLMLHGWWFDLAAYCMWIYQAQTGVFQDVCHGAKVVLSVE